MGGAHQGREMESAVTSQIAQGDPEFGGVLSTVDDRKNLAMATQRGGEFHPVCAIVRLRPADLDPPKSGKKVANLRLGHDLDRPGIQTVEAPRPEWSGVQRRLRRRGEQKRRSVV